MNKAFKKKGKLSFGMAYPRRGIIISVSMSKPKTEDLAGYEALEFSNLDWVVPR